MNAKPKIVFRRIRGRIVPIKAQSLGVKLTKVAVAAEKGVKVAHTAGSIAAYGGLKKVNVKPHRGFQALGLATAVADGLVSGLTFFTPGAKAFVAGQALGIGLGAGSSAANAYSFVGKGAVKERIKGAARQEGINTILGNAVFAGTLLAVPSSRARIFGGIAKAASFVARKARFIR